MSRRETPHKAVLATERLQPRPVVPIHWGTYSPTGASRREPAWLERPATEFAAEVAAVGYRDRLRLFQPGERLSRPAPERR